MKHKLSKIPVLRGSTQQQVDQLKNYMNTLVDELTRALDAKDAEIERLRKEVKGDERKR